MSRFQASYVSYTPPDAGYAPYDPPADRFQVRPGSQNPYPSNAPINYDYQSQNVSYQSNVDRRLPPFDSQHVERSYADVSYEQSMYQQDYSVSSQPQRPNYSQAPPSYSQPPPVAEQPPAAKTSWFSSLFSSKKKQPQSEQNSSGYNPDPSLLAPSANGGYPQRDVSPVQGSRRALPLTTIPEENESPHRSPYSSGIYPEGRTPRVAKAERPVEVIVGVPEVCRLQNPMGADKRVTSLQDSLLSEFGGSISLVAIGQVESWDWIVTIRVPDQQEELAYQGDLIQPPEDQGAPPALRTKIAIALKNAGKTWGKEQSRSAPMFSMQVPKQEVNLDVCRRFVRDCAYQLAASNSEDAVEVVRSRYSSLYDLRQIDQALRVHSDGDEVIAFFRWEVDVLAATLNQLPPLPAYYWTLHGIRMSANAHRLSQRLFHLFGGSLPFRAWLALCQKNDPAMTEQAFQKDLWDQFGGLDAVGDRISPPVLLQRIERWFYGTEEYRAQLQFESKPPIKDVHFISLLQQLDLLWAVHVEPSELQRVMDQYQTQVTIISSPPPELVLKPPASNWFTCCLPMVSS